MNVLAVINIVRLISSRHGKPKSGGVSGVTIREYRDDVIWVVEKFNPPQLFLDTAMGHKIMHLSGANLLHWDESRLVSEHLLKLVPEGVLDVKASEPPSPQEDT